MTEVTTVTGNESSLSAMEWASMEAPLPNEEATTHKNLEGWMLERAKSMGIEQETNDDDDDDDGFWAPSLDVKSRKPPSVIPPRGNWEPAGEQVYSRQDMLRLKPLSKAHWPSNSKLIIQDAAPPPKAKAKNKPKQQAKRKEEKKPAKAEPSDPASVDPNRKDAKNPRGGQTLLGRSRADLDQPQLVRLANGNFAMAENRSPD
mmetsp:Transcript_18656/g.42867  ORF Transcript_18656/g.42867 Transcript_18656/m.42867 type:complete len:203 (+) Transcript_18656:132-740(+)